MPSKTREWFLRLATLLGSLFVCLLLLEVMVRLIEPREVARYFFVQPDSVVHHKFIPHAKSRFKTSSFDTHYEINSLGLRDKEYSLKKPIGVTRILMLGDSFTEGIGVEANETFSKVLESLLNGEGKAETYEVINAGVGSYSPLPEYLYLKTAGLMLDPDVVVLNLDLSDAFDDIQYTKLARFDAAGVPLGVSPDPVRHNEGWWERKLVAIKDLLRENTRLYNFITLRIGRYIEGTQHEGSALGDLRWDKYAMLRPNHIYKDQDWYLTHKYILLVRDLLKERGIRFVLTVYPYGMQVSPREFNTGRQFWGFRPDTLYSTQPQDSVEEFCKRENITVINTCQGFRESSASQYPMYIDDNGHWNATGQKVFAQILFRELRARRVLIDGETLNTP